MTGFLNDNDLAKLHAKFIVPIVIDQMLRDEEPLDEIAEHAMNEILCDFYPDSALLCIALCARHIAQQTWHLNISRALKIEADQIIEEYGPLWIAHEQNPEACDDLAVYDLLMNIPEDFEVLRDLLEATLSEIEEDHCVAAILCDILSLQADYHRDLADAELLSLSLKPHKKAEHSFTPGGTPDEACGNVIPFPRAAKRRVQSVRS